jgi:comEA protein
MKKLFRGSLAIALAVVLFISVSNLSFAQNQTQNRAAQAKININTASLAELQTLPRIGPKVAQRIIDYRTQNGPFKKVEDLMKVRGIGEKVFNQIKDLITVGETR